VGNDDGASAAASVLTASLSPATAAEGRLHIGFRTGQTTGAGAHVAGSGLVPTVEREAVDLGDEALAAWNGGLLALGGGVVRLV
ncbi:hypothetical protein BU14_0172s0033, partial [Porphyra umbilicalis]